MTIKIPREVFITPKPSAPPPVSKARATEARDALQNALNTQRQRMTDDIRNSDYITTITVFSAGSAGYALQAQVKPVSLASEAIGEAGAILKKLGFGNVRLYGPMIAQGAEMQKPRS